MAYVKGEQYYCPDCYIVHFFAEWDINVNRTCSKCGGPLNLIDNIVGQI